MAKSLEGNQVKSAYAKIEYNEEMLEQLSACSDPNDGYMYFITNYGHIKHPERGMILYKPFNYQYKLLNVYHNYRFSISMVGRQMGKALAGDTPILTSEGVKTMKEIKIGDTVYNELGQPTKVISKTSEQNNRECYAVNFRHGETIIADGEHLWNVGIRDKDGLILTTKDIESFMANYSHKPSNRRCPVRIKKSNIIEFDEREVPIKPYDMGVWLGDGFSLTNKITTHIDDYYEYMKLMDITEGKFRKNSTTCIDFKFNNFSMHDLRRLNLIKNKRILNEYIMNSSEVRMELLRGLMDSDGTVEKNGTCRFYQSNLDLITDVRFLLSTLGVKTTLRSKYTGFKTAYTLCFVCNEFDVFKLPRKLSRQYLNKSDKKNDNFYIKSIEKVDSVSVYCIEVDNPTHLFLAGNTLIPTHNCVMGNTMITIRNKNTGEVKTVSFKDFHEDNI